MVHENRFASARTATWRRATAVLLAAAVGLPLHLAGTARFAGAGPGDPTSSFGNGGSAQVEGGGERHLATAIEQVLVAFDGTTTAIGAVDSTSSQAWAERVLPSGAPDLSFGVGGRRTVGGAAAAPAGAYDAVGRLVTVDGSTVRRALPDGSPDPSFDGDGTRAISTGEVVAAIGPVPSFNEVQLTAVRPLPSGQILVGGGFDSSWPAFVLALGPGGSFDSSYGTSGVGAFQGSSVERLERDDAGRAVGCLRDRYAGGHGARYKAFRMTTAGGLDPSFSDDGLVDASDCNGFAVDGNLIYASHYGGLRRIDATGAPDGSFGQSGVLSTSVETSRIAVDPAHRVVVADPFLTTVQRITPAGAVDGTFGGSGVAQTGMPSTWPPPGHSALGVDGSGRVVLGFVNRLLRLKADGSVDDGFSVTFSGPAHPLDSYLDAVALPDGSMLTVFQSDDDAGPHLVVAKLTPTGGLDPRYGAGGRRILAPWAGDPGAVHLVAGADRSLYVASTDAGGTALRHLTPDGTVDPAFTQPSGAYGPGWPTAMVADASGSLLVRTTQSRVLRIAANGAVESSIFDASGSYLAEMAVDSKDRVLLMTRIEPMAGPDDVAIRRYTRSGTLDVSWGNGGLATFDLSGWQAGPSDLTVTATDGVELLTYREGGSPGDFNGLQVTRLSSAGRLDRSFGQGGTVSIALSRQAYGDAHLALQPDGSSLVVAKGAEPKVRRLTSDGLVDPGFSAAAPSWLVDPVVKEYDVPVSKGAHFGVLILPAGRVALLGSTLVPRGPSVDLDVVDLVLDGTTPSPAGVAALVPSRVLDTRPGQQTVDGLAEGAGPIGPGETRTLLVTGRGGVPSAGVGAVVLNVTATGPTST